jgi:hypothetical protein
MEGNEQNEYEKLDGIYSGENATEEIFPCVYYIICVPCLTSLTKFFSSAAAAVESWSNDEDFNASKELTFAQQQRQAFIIWHCQPHNYYYYTRLIPNHIIPESY